MQTNNQANTKNKMTPSFVDAPPEITASTSSMASIAYHTEAQWTTIDTGEAVKHQLHDLRLDLRRVQVNGLTGNIFLWWIHPVKFMGDPVLELAEAALPFLTERIPYSDLPVIAGLSITKTVAHSLYGVAASTGLVSTNTAYESVRVLSHLQSLKEQSEEWKAQFLDGLYSAAGKKVFLLGVHESVFKSVCSHREELLTLMYQGYSALYNVRVGARRPLHESHPTTHLLLVFH